MDAGISAHPPCTSKWCHDTSLTFRRSRSRCPRRHERSFRVEGFCARAQTTYTMRQRRQFARMPALLDNRALSPKQHGLQEEYNPLTAREHLELPQAWSQGYQGNRLICSKCWPVSAVSRCAQASSSISSLVLLLTGVLSQ